MSSVIFVKYIRIFCAREADWTPASLAQKIRIYFFAVRCCRLEEIDIHTWSGNYIGVKGCW